ncbi:FirrV-1-A37 [Feldmannia irregularis virus a]|uniref:FirrV-1-A37 n=1 Tax=Feldmannia irregularis virus a TaxID=231992 RepID=Q6XM50_9PHYC|nr:FirrV-1-A37 [Feldmannia irregularis virus a]AAR26861.1 FirrV-1-A37 [Feldmannia irregularis virus a]
MNTSDSMETQGLMSVYDTSAMDETLKKMGELIQDDEYADVEQNNNKRSLMLLKTWLTKCSIRARTHAKLSMRAGVLDVMLSIPKLFFGGAATALSFWATSDINGSSHGVRVLVATLSAVSTILASLGQFLRYDEARFRHQMASGMYSQLCRKIEMLVFSDFSDSTGNRDVAEIAARFANIATFSPQIQV